MLYATFLGACHKITGLMDTTTTSDEGLATPIQKRDQGEIVLRGKTLAWKTIDHEVKFIHPDSNQTLSYGELSSQFKLTEADERALMNQLLAHYRPYGFPDGGNYYTASAGITDTGQLFVEVTNQKYIVESFAGRGCAETRMLAKAQDALGTTDPEKLQFKAVYLMASKGKKLADGSIENVPKHQPIGCLCGECRVNLRKHTKNAKFVMMTANDGTVELSVNRTNLAPAIGENAAWEFGHNTMYPLPEYVDLPESSQPIAQLGYDYITQASVQALALKNYLTDALENAQEDGDNVIIPKPIRDILLKRQAFVTQSLPQLEGNPGLENINRAMLQLMKEAHAEHAKKISDSNNAEITVVLVKNKKGQFFSATLVDGKDWLPAKPPSSPTALSNAYNQKGFDEVYVMTFNDKQLREERQAKAQHALKMPDPAALNRITKNLEPQDNPTIRIIAVNDGTLTQETLEAMSVSHKVREAFGPDYINPKLLKEQEIPQLH